MSAVGEATGGWAVAGRRLARNGSWTARLAALGRALFRARLPTLVVGIVILGALPRVWLFLERRSLWTDEAIIAMALLGLEGMSLELVTVPKGWYMLVQTVAAVGGLDERVLRAVPLVAGLTAPPLMYVVARRHARPVGAIVATALLAVSGPALYFSNELKPYMTDVVAALVLSLLLLAPGPGAFGLRGTVIRLLASVAAVWFSNPAIFVLAGYLSVAFAQAVVTRNWRRGVAVATIGIAVLASFGANYWHRIVPTQEIPGMQNLLEEFWAQAFPPFPIASSQDLRWYADLLAVGAWYPVGMDHAGAWVLPGAVGIAWLAWRRPWLCLSLLGPIAYMMVAALLHFYPLQGRLLLFLAPTMALFLGIGVVFLAGLAGRFAPLAGALLAMGVLLATAPSVRETFAPPHPEPQHRPIYEFIRANWQAADRVYVYGRWGWTDRFYAAHMGLPDEARLGRNRTLAERAEAALEGRRVPPDDPLLLQGEGRVWVVTLENDRRRAAEVLDRAGTHLGKFRSHGAAVMLYGFSACTGPCLEPLPEPGGDPTLD